jgi:hypothetical protein
LKQNKEIFLLVKPSTANKSQNLAEWNHEINLQITQRHYMRNIYLVFIAFAIYMKVTGQTAKTADTEKNSVDKIICISGSMSNDSKAFIKYVAALTRKAQSKNMLRPNRICRQSIWDCYLV